MGELSHMARQLKALDTIDEVKEGTTGGDIVYFNVDAGEYATLTSEMITLMAAWDADVYPENDSDLWDYIAVSPATNRHRPFE